MPCEGRNMMQTVMQNAFDSSTVNQTHAQRPKAKGLGWWKNDPDPMILFI